MRREYSPRHRPATASPRRLDVRELQPGDRPREKLARGGPESLGDNELVALVIGHGSHRVGALDVAQEVLSVAGGVHGLPRLHKDRLLQLPGIGIAQASRLQAAIELGRRTLLTPPVERPRFQSPREAALYLLPRFGSHPVERFGVLLLDTRLRLVATRLISVGLLDASLAHPREVFREALLASAAALVVFHNHPSGDPTPSPEDLRLTLRLRQAGSIVGVELADHVILGEGRYYSMKEARAI
jgi:DNA repair protein RadC